MWDTSSPSGVCGATPRTTRSTRKVASQALIGHCIKPSATQ